MTSALAYVVVATGEQRGELSVTDRWWFPLAVTATAAFASYLATWSLKRRDVEREIALQAVALVSRAGEVASLSDEEFKRAGGSAVIKDLLGNARLAVFPLRDGELDYRLLLAERFTFDTFDWAVPRVWLREAINNARLGLVGYLAPPRLAPWRKGARHADRTFPTYRAYDDAQIEEPTAIFDWLGEWMNTYEAERRRSVRRRARRVASRFRLVQRSPYQDT